MKRKEKIILYILILLVVICGLISQKMNGCKIFWSMNIGDILGILVTGIVLFNLTNVIASRGKKEEYFLGLIEKLQASIGDERLKNIQSEDDIEFVKMRNRKIANIIHCIDKMKLENREIRKNIENIKEQMNSYEMFFDNHLTDLGYLKKSKKELCNYIDLIDNRCDDIKGEIYK